MRKGALLLLLAMCLLCTAVLPAEASGNAAVAYTGKERLEYIGILGWVKDGVLLDENSNLAPGSTVSAAVDIKNDSTRVMHFYMNAKVLATAEELARTLGAACRITMTGRGGVIYDSCMGGYDAAGVVNSEGLKEMESVLGEYILVGILDQGQSESITIQVTFDGEGMDSVRGNRDYTNIINSIGLDFMAYSEDHPEMRRIVNTTIITRPLRVVKRVGGQIIEEVEDIVPGVAEVIVSPKTGDKAMLGGGVAMLLLGIGVVYISGRKRRGEKA